MAVTNILVEGKDDIVFVSRLIDVMRGELGLSALKWRLVSQENKITINGSKKRCFGDAAVSVGEDCVAITETGGVYQPPGPELLVVKAPEPKKVDLLVCLFDADAPTNFLGNSVKFGGLPDRREYVEKLYSRVSVGRRYFFFPDDSHNGTLEDLVIATIRPELKFVIDRSWPEYRKQVRADLANIQHSYLEYSSKCALSQFSTVFDVAVAKDLYWVAALWNDDMWDWQAVSLFPVKEFLRTNVPSLFR